jgi:hypothetical protein
LSPRSGGVAENDAPHGAKDEGLQMRRSIADCMVQLVGGFAIYSFGLKSAFAAVAS